MSDLPSMLDPLTVTFPGWPAVEEPSFVEALLVLILIPLAIMAVVGLVTVAGNLSRRGRGHTLELTVPLWLGQTSSATPVAADSSRPALATAGGSSVAGESSAAHDATTTGLVAWEDPIDSTTTGGASVRW